MNRKYTLVLVRHGQSEFNLSKQFAGWTDIALTKQGETEAWQAALILKQFGYKFTSVHTSVLRRSIQTWNIMAEYMDHSHIETQSHWRLNEIHYGQLQGLNKPQAKKDQGEEQVLKWRRSYDNSPPVLDLHDPRHPVHDPLYSSVPKHVLPGAESLAQLIERVKPQQNDVIAKEVLKHEKVLVVAHQNSIRGILQMHKNQSEQQLAKLEIPNAFPMVLEFDNEMKLINDFYLGDQKDFSKSVQSLSMNPSRQGANKSIQRSFL